MGNDTSCESGGNDGNNDNARCGIDEHCYNVGYDHGSNSDVKNNDDLVGEGLEAFPCTLSDHASKAYGEGYVDGVNNRDGTSYNGVGISSGDHSSSNGSYPNGSNGNEDPGQPSNVNMYSKDIIPSKTYVGGFDYYTFENGQIVFKNDSNCFVNESDFMNFHHYKPWNTSHQFAVVYMRDKRTPFTKDFFHYDATKFAYSPYDSPETIKLKDEYNSIVNRIYFETNGFTTNKTSFDKFKVGDLKRRTEKSCYHDYKKQCEVNRSKGLNPLT